MKRLTIYILCILIAWLLIGCRTRIQYIPVKELEFHNVYLRDTTIKTVLVPYRDSISSRDTSSYLKNKYADSWAVWSNGILSHSLNITPDTIPLDIKIQEIEIIRKVEIPIEVEKKLSRFEKIKMNFGGWAIGLLSGCLIYIVLLFIRRKK